MANSFVLKIKRGESPFYRFLYRTAKWLTTASLPLPRALHPVLRGMFSLHQGVMSLCRGAATYFYREPLFRGRCETIGARFTLSKMPFVNGHARIEIGDDVNFFGKVDIFSGRIFDEPRLILQNRINVGHNVGFTVNREIVIEDDVTIGSGARIMDTDSHPKDLWERVSGLPPRAEEIKPVRICRYAWIGQNSFIMKGVTIGEGAIIGVNSVVVTDIPPYAVAMGNPARVVVKGVKPDPPGA